MNILIQLLWLAGCLCFTSATIIGLVRLCR